MKQCLLFKIITRLSKEKNYFLELLKNNINEQTIIEGIYNTIKQIENEDDPFPSFLIVCMFSKFNNKSVIKKTLYTYEFDKNINQILFVILKPHIKYYLEKNLLTNKLLNIVNNNIFKKNYSFDEYYELIQKNNINILNFIRCISWKDNSTLWKEENKKFIIFLLNLLIKK